MCHTIITIATLGGGRGGTMLVESKYGKDFRKDSDTECVNSMAVSGDY